MSKSNELSDQEIVNMLSVIIQRVEESNRDDAGDLSFCIRALARSLVNCVNACKHDKECNKICDARLLNGQISSQFSFCRKKQTSLLSF